MVIGVWTDMHLIYQRKILCIRFQRRYKDKVLLRLHIHNKMVLYNIRMLHNYIICGLTVW